MITTLFTERSDHNHGYEMPIAPQQRPEIDSDEEKKKAVKRQEILERPPASLPNIFPGPTNGEA